MMRFPPILPPEEDEEEEIDWVEEARIEIVEYLLRRYGNLAARDIAKVLGWKTGEVNEILAVLEHQGRVEKVKLGRKQIWVYRERSQSLMYY